MKVWVLTREINQYDQDGSYFEAVFQDKPSQKQLEDAGVSIGSIDFTLNNKNHDDTFSGGRSPRMEDTWWNLELVDLK
jgi:hypothetical protein